MINMLFECLSGGRRVFSLCCHKLCSQKELRVHIYLQREREKGNCSNQTKALSFSFPTLTRVRVVQLHSKGTITIEIVQKI